MGQAKLRRMNPPSVIYHHTSTLRTNQLWMSGYIALEGKMPKVLHPDLGEMETDARFRRAMADFPPLAWFTTQISIPRCLVLSSIQFVRDGGAVERIDIGKDVGHAIALNRIAIGFPIADLTVIRWVDHHGFDTREGRELNETARDAGDNPGDWYVAEQPVDLMLASEVWTSASRSNPKLKRNDVYFPDMKRMVRLCREVPGTFIPPSWMTQDQAMELARRVGKPIANLR